MPAPQGQQRATFYSRFARGSKRFVNLLIRNRGQFCPTGAGGVGGVGGARWKRATFVLEKGVFWWGKVALLGGKSGPFAG